MFEASEKKLEIIINKEQDSLKNLPDKFWNKVVQSCGAHIISQQKHKDLHAFLLSESSLFVWDHRIVMITCGKTVLPLACLQILKTIPPNQIDFLFYQRKNEFFPHNQKSTFLKDIKSIKDKLPGQAYQLGLIHEHHCLLFHSTTEADVDRDDKTYEVLMYDSGLLKQKGSDILKTLKEGLGEIFPGFSLQDHSFEPEGYSLNAVRGTDYYTIHITPEDPCCYISFEASLKGYDMLASIDRLVHLLQARSFDLIIFLPLGNQDENHSYSSYFKTLEVFQTLTCGYKVAYMHFTKDKTQLYQAKLLN